VADEPHPGRVPTITDEQVGKVAVDTLEEAPDDATKGAGRWLPHSRQGQNGQSQRREGGHSGSTRPAVVSGGLACINSALMLARHWLPAFSRQKTPTAGEGPVPAPAAAAS